MLAIHPALLGPAGGPRQFILHGGAGPLRCGMLDSLAGYPHWFVLACAVLAGAVVLWLLFKLLQAGALAALFRRPLCRQHGGDLAFFPLTAAARPGRLKKLARAGTEAYPNRVKYIFVTGGVVSSLGKGLG